MTVRDVTKKEIQEIQQALAAIAGGYSYEVSRPLYADDAPYEVVLVAIENPDFRPDDGSNPKLVFRVHMGVVQAEF